MAGRSLHRCGLAQTLESVLGYHWRHALTMGLCGLQELTFLDDDVTVENARVGARRQLQPHSVDFLSGHITRRSCQLCCMNSKSSHQPSIHAMLQHSALCTKYP